MRVVSRELEVENRKWMHDKLQQQIFLRKSAESAGAKFSVSAESDRVLQIDFRNLTVEYREL